MKELIEILEKFDRIRTEKRNLATWNKETVAECFFPCAEEILCNGYFLVNNRYIIDLGAIELYYHEEDGTIKDHIMYHTNEHLPAKYKEIIKHDGGYPYFEFGSFNLHTSGVDITFENPKEKYRASFLIRSYRVLNKDENPSNLEKPFDACSTHLFDDMFFSGIMLGSETVKWEIKNKAGKIIQHQREHVACYQLKKNKFERISKTDYAADKMIQNQFPKPEFFKYGRNEYLQDSILWQFKREGIKEEK